MPNQLLEAKRSLVDFHFRQGAPLDDAMREPDVRREWRMLTEAGAHAYLVTGGDIVLDIQLDGRSIRAATLLDGAAAAALLDQHAYQPSPAVLAAAKAEPLGSFAKLFVARTLDDDATRLVAPHGQRHYTWSWGAVLVLDVPHGDIVRGYRFISGRAAQRLRETPLPLPWDKAAPDPNGPHHARTLGEALVFLRGVKALWLDERRTQTTLEVLAHTMASPMVFQFLIDDPFRRDPLDLGDGQSDLLDPADWVLRASALEQELPERRTATADDRHRAVWSLQLAAACLRQALAFVPPGADLPPEGPIWRTAVARHLRATSPDRFSRAGLTAKIASLEAAEAAW